jgi:dUTP pyrophosphatase
MLDVKIKLLNADAVIPNYEHLDDSGIDLRALKEYTLNPGEVALIPTGIAVQFPHGYEAQIRSRSGLAAKRKLVVINSPATIDKGYTGEIKVALLNQNDFVQGIEKGMRIAQMVFAPVIQAQFTLVTEFEETSRGEGGFGSTGTK